MKTRDGSSRARVARNPRWPWRAGVAALAVATLALGSLTVVDAAAADAAPPVAPAAAVAAAPDDRIALREDGARWESGYGEKFFQVVGTVTNGGDATVGAVRIRTELLDGSGKVVAAFDGWNARAEALGDLALEAARAELPAMRPDPIPPGQSDRFRATFLADETPAFSAHRARVAGVLPPP